MGKQGRGARMKLVVLDSQRHQYEPMLSLNKYREIQKSYGDVWICIHRECLEGVIPW
jgi:hypothetical protein